MTLRNSLPTLLVISVTALGLVAGCGKSPDKSTSDGKTEKSKTPGKHADPHDIPLTQEEKDQLKKDVATYQKALAHIKQYRDTIKKETTGGVPAKAHRSLDKLDLVLEWLPEIAQKSNIPKDQWATIGSNAQKLRELFNKVHQNIDDGNPPNYEAVDADIEKSIKALEAVKTQ